MDNSFEITDVDEVTKKIAVKIPAEAVTARLDKEFTQVASNTSIKGFRKGKAPEKLVDQLYGARVRLEVARMLVTESLEQILRDNTLQTVGDPELDFGQPEKDKEFLYTAQVFLFPTPEIAGYDKVSVEVEHGAVSDEDIEKSIHSILESRATLKKVEGRDEAQDGDVIDGLFTVMIEGEEPGQPEPLVVALGDNKLPPELEKGIVGQKIGEVREVEGALPEEHKDESLRGKKTTYKVELKALSEKVLPELQDGLVKELGLGVETVLELRMKIRENLEKEKEAENKTNTQAKILDRLLEANNFLVPQVLIDDEIRHMLVRFGLIDPKKVDVSQISVEAFREKLGEEAGKRVRTAVIVDRIAEQEKLTATEKDITSALEDIAEQNGMSVEEVKQFFTSNDRVLSFTVEQTRNKVLDFLVDKAEVKKKAA